MKVEQERGEPIRKFTERFSNDLLETEEYDYKFIITIINIWVRDERKATSLYTRPLPRVRELMAKWGTFMIDGKLMQERRI